MDRIGQYLVILLNIIILLSSIIIIVFYKKFQLKIRKKEQEILKLIEEKEKSNLFYNCADNSKDIDNNSLLLELYNLYIAFLNKLNYNNKDFDNILDDFMKELYETKIDSYITKKFREVTDNIELNGYSMIEQKDNIVIFRVNINCISYKECNGTIISGSSFNRVQRISIVTCVNKEGIWLINKVENVYEKKLGN